MPLIWFLPDGGISDVCLCVRLTVWFSEFGSVFLSRVSPRILHTEAKSGAYLRGSTPRSRFPLRFPSEPYCAIESVPSIFFQAIAHRWRSPPRIPWYRASSQGNSINGNWLLRLLHRLRLLRRPINVRLYWYIHWACVPRFKAILWPR